MRDNKNHPGKVRASNDNFRTCSSPSFQLLEWLKSENDLLIGFLITGELQFSTSKPIQENYEDVMKVRTTWSLYCEVRRWQLLT